MSPGTRRNPAVAKCASKAKAYRTRRDRIRAKLVASTKLKSRSSKRAKRVYARSSTSFGCEDPFQAGRVLQRSHESSGHGPTPRHPSLRPARPA
jgi:hypothetical protein